MELNVHIKVGIQHQGIPVSGGITTEHCNTLYIWKQELGIIYVRKY